MPSIMSLSRKYSKVQLCVDIHKYSLSSSTSASRCPVRALKTYDADVKSARFHSTDRNSFKAEAPIGIVDEAQSSFQISLLKKRLGQSFTQLSGHINSYFKSKDLIKAGPQFVGRAMKRQRTHGNMRKEAQKYKSVDVKETARPQLFHISTLTTKFGESYSYVSSHINSAFTHGSTKAQNQKEMETISSGRRQKRCESSNSVVKPGETKRAKVDMNIDQAMMESNHSSLSWEESYQYLTRHINKYFRAKASDEVGARNEIEPLPAEQNSAAKSHSQVQRNEGTSQTGNLFHSSQNATRFGENHLQMSSHINQYFKGRSSSDENDRLEIKMENALPEAWKPTSVSFVDCLRRPSSAIPVLSNYLNLGAFAQAKPKAKTLLDKKVGQAEDLIISLVHALRLAPSSDAVLNCVEALNEQLSRYPSCKALMWQGKSAAMLLKRRRDFRNDPTVQSAIRETLALIGYVDSVKGHGIRVLSIDGGGTRGLVPLQVLKILEAETGKKIHQLFDYICGVSTGAVLAFMLGLARFSLEECADMYRRFGSEVFRQNRLVGTMKMGWTHSYYNSETWETILREKLGEKVLIKTARDEFSPKVSAVSAVVNWGSSPKAFVFCNYNHKPGSLSRYAGGSGYPMWQAVRASSAAPGYFQEFTLQSDIHQDGGIIMNNPCALAVHESRLLWPKQPFQCVLSLGTGRYDNAKRGSTTSTSLRAKISNLICSATDTEGVHTLLDDLLAPDVYFRFNPMLKAQVSLDESRPEVLDQLQKDTYCYLERNRPKLARLCLVLGAERSAVSRTRDWVSERAWEMKQRWV
ncbi:calcium-independent phospholipase A2-gamma-like [Synchiropus picturatus]